MNKKWITLSLAVMTAISVTACGIMGGKYEPLDETKVVVVTVEDKQSQVSDFWEDTSENSEMTEDETLPKIVIAAEVAQVDDEEDPEMQRAQEVETGAEVDFGQMIAQEKAKQETESAHDLKEVESQSGGEEATSAQTQDGRGKNDESRQTPAEETQVTQEELSTIESKPENLPDKTTPPATQPQQTEVQEDKTQETKSQETKPREVTPDSISPGQQIKSGLSYGIDVSKWQDKIDWQEVKETGIDFAIIRVGYRTQKTGVIFEDPFARYNLQEASKAGIKLGAYFFSTAVTEEEALEEAAWLCSVIDQYPITYPVVYNCEGFRNAGNRQYGMSKEERSDMAVTFLDYVKKQGYKPMFYAAKNELTGSADWDTQRLGSKYPIWVSQYPIVPYPETPKSSYEGEHAMWQYTSQGKVDGISKPVDVNVAYFTIDQIAVAKNTEAAEVVEDSPELGITFTETNEIVTAKIATNLRTVPSTASSDTVVYKLMNGETVTRTGIGDNGWSRVQYHGQNLYAVSSYLTTELPEHAQPATMQTDAPQAQGPGGTAVQEGPGAETQIETNGTETPDEPEPEVEPGAAPGAEQVATTSQADDIYQKVNEQVTAKDRTNLRSKPGSDYTDTIVYTLQNGEVAVRTGIGINGWSRVEFNGQTLYAVTSYLTTDLESTPVREPEIASDLALADFPNLTFTEVHENVTAKIETNLRTEPSTRSDDTVVVKLIRGDVAVRTGLGSNGWSRVEYDGQTLYAVTSYLTVVE